MILGRCQTKGPTVCNATQLAKPIRQIRNETLENTYPTYGSNCKHIYIYDVYLLVDLWP